MDVLKESVTREDADNIIQYCLRFRVKLSDEDLSFIFNTYINTPEGQALDEETSKRLKMLCCQMLLSGQDMFDDKLFEEAKISASKILKDETDSN